MNMKFKELFIFSIPSMVGVLMILFIILNLLNNNMIITNETSWFWIFLGLILISNSIVTMNIIFNRNDF
jgi:hypothetical protein